MSGIGFLGVPEFSLQGQRLFDDDIAEVGYVMNASRLWAYQPGTLNGLFDLMRDATAEHELDVRQRGILVAACASTLGDSYCSLSWGSMLAAASDAPTAAAVLRGDDDGLTTRERAMAGWARKVAGAPNATNAADVEQLREAGYSDVEVFAITVFVALRLASRPSTMHSVRAPMLPSAAPRPMLFSRLSPSAVPSLRTRRSPALRAHRPSRRTPIASGEPGARVAGAHPRLA
ncbi:MAG: hypothetical protein WKF51_09245 [Geodermatophilaceae bacterium]